MTQQYDVVGFGEIMLRLSVPPGRRLEVTDTLNLHPGGAEGNVVSALGALGRQTTWVGGLPRNPLGALVRNHLRRSGVNTESIIWKDDTRMGLFFIEFSGEPRGTEVYYDRANSAASLVAPDDLPWSTIRGARIVHISGITPAISESSKRATEALLMKCRTEKIPVSFDVNFRSKLWSESQAAETLIPMMQGVEILFCGRGDARNLFQAPEDPAACIRHLAELTGAKHVVVSLGDEGAIGLCAGELIRAEQGRVAIVDRIGAGDAMAAGVLHGWLSGDFRKGLDYGMLMASIALSVDGDTVYTSAEEVESLLKQRRSGVRR